MSTPTIVQRVTELAKQIGKDIKETRSSIGSLSSLHSNFSSNSASSSLVDAINYLNSNSGAVINDKIATSANTYSAQKVVSIIGDTQAMTDTTVRADSVTGVIEKVFTKLFNENKATSNLVTHEASPSVPLDTDISTELSENLPKAINKAYKTNKDKIEAIINDNSPSTTSTYSSTKIDSVISTKVAAVVDGAPAAFDTLKEVATWIEGSSSAVTAINNKVPYDSTISISETQKQNVWDTIGLGSRDVDLLALYNEAKA